MFEKIKSYFIEDDWNIAVVNKPITKSVSDHSFLEEITWIKKKEGYFIADPFGIPDEGKILCEYYSYQSRKGKIVSSSLSSNNMLSNVRSEFDLAAHLSYPYIFNYQDSIYCIPEMSELNKACLYQYRNGTFVYVKDLLNNIDAVDTTFFEHGDYCWLATTKASHKFGNEQLYLFYSKGLLDSWQPHKANPVKTDVRSSRSAGTPFSIDGTLFRPAQNCQHDYGKEIVINKIKELTPHKFVEEEERIIKAGKLGDGIHTISFFGEQTLIDIKIKRISLMKPLRLFIFNMRIKSRKAE